VKINITDVLSIEGMIVERQIYSELNAFSSKLGNFPIIGKTPFMMHLENKENKHLLITGETDVSVAVPCDRCLQEVPVRIHLTIDQAVPIGEAASEGVMEGTGYLAGTSLDVDRLIHDEILVSWPTKVLCSKDCKGICRKCGANLNRESCACSKAEPDPRMAAIQDIFNQFKEV
jgi:uncharacterized protein